MKTTFNLQQALSARREIVIAKYNNLTGERFFDGCTLRQFMIEVMNLCTINRIRSEKRLDSMLATFIDNVYHDHSRIQSRDVVTDALRKKYAGTAFMAMV